MYALTKGYIDSGEKQFNAFGQRPNKSLQAKGNVPPIVGLIAQVRPNPADTNAINQVHQLTKQQLSWV